MLLFLKILNCGNPKSIDRSSLFILVLLNSLWASVFFRSIAQERALWAGWEASEETIRMCERELCRVAFRRR